MSVSPPRGNRIALLSIGKESEAEYLLPTLSTNCLSMMLSAAVALLLPSNLAELRWRVSCQTATVVSTTVLYPEVEMTIGDDLSRKVS